MKRPLLWSAVLGMTSSMLVTLSLATTPAQAAINASFTETFSSNLDQWDLIQNPQIPVIKNGRLTSASDGETLLRSKFSAVHDVARFDVYAGQPGAAVYLYLNANDHHVGSGIALVSASSPAGGTDAGAFNHLQMGMSFAYPGMPLPPISAATVTLARNYISDFYMAIDPHAPGEPTTTYPLGLTNTPDTSGTRVTIGVRNGAAIDNFTMGTRDEANVSWTTAAASGTQLNVGSSINALTVPADTRYGLDTSTPETCTVNNTIVTGLAMGKCTLTASTLGNHVYKASANKTTQLLIRPTSAVPTRVDREWTGDAGPGPTRTAEFIVKATDGRYAEFDGTMRIQIGQSAPVTLPVSNNRVSFELPNTAGQHTVVATYVPADTRWSLGSTHTSTYEVARAATTIESSWTSNGLSLQARSGQQSVAGTFTVTLAGDERSFETAGTPIDVPFPNRPAGATISVEFSGNSDYLPSNKTITLSAPSLSATADRAATNGWYRAPVTYTFSCDAGASVLATVCPTPVTLSAEGRDQTVPGAITTADGVSATSGAKANLDLTAPIVQLAGITDGATYPALPEYSCSVTDALSGSDGCETTRTELSQGKVQISATGRDVAGNTATITKTLTLKTPPASVTPTPSTPVVVGPVTVTPGTGAPKVTKSGTTVRIVRATKKRSTVVLTVKSRKRPTTLKLARNVKGIKIAKAKLVKKGKKGIRNWRITITMAPKATKRFNLKMRVNGKIRVLKLLIVR